MREETIQITRERHVSDPVRYAEAQSVDAVAEFILSKESALLPASFADVLEYPGDDWTEHIDSLSETLRGETALFGHFDQFCLKTRPMSLIELQELYAQSFDLNPSCALEIGYHLFGEDYKRGAFLANLRETENPFDLGQERQLPDYLPVLLRLLVHLDDDDLRGSLAGHCLIPGLKKIIAAFKEQNPFLELIKAVQTALEQATTEKQGFAIA